MASKTKKLPAEIGKATVRQLAIASLQDAVYNPRVISDEAMGALRASLLRYGLVEPVVVNVRGGKNTIVGGHQRVRVMIEEGIDKCACVIVDLSKKDEKLLNLALNNLDGQGEFVDGIDEYIEKLRGEVDNDDLMIDLRLIELEDEIEGLTDPDDVPDPPKKAKTKPGQLWLLGDHRLLCGDSTKVEDVERLMGGEKADMVFTDPPYNVGKDYEGETLSTAEFTKFHKTYLNILFEQINDDSPCYFCFGVKYLFEFADELRKYMKPRLLIWYKPDSHGAGGGDYFYNYEAIFYGSKSGEKAAKSYDAEARDVWIINKAKESDGGFEHPTVKPVAVPSAAIETSSRKGDLILDIFLGSGSTMIACEKTGRRCFGMELEPIYCDVIIKRWQDFTGNKAELAE